jgi:hypothetical protein
LRHDQNKFYPTLNPRPKAEFSDLGRFYTHRAFGLRMPDRLPRRSRPLRRLSAVG